MTSNDETREDLVGQFEEREAGVVDLLDLYERIEAVYVAASQASEVPYATTSNSTNRG